MGWANKIIGWTTNNGAEVDASNQLLAKTKADTLLGSSIRAVQENDAGLATGTPYLVSAEVDEDYRLRVANDVVLDEEDITYSAQNFTKHGMYATTFVPAWTTAGFNTNPTNVTTTGSSVLFKTYKTFSMEGTETLSLDLEGAFTYASGAAVPSNQTIEFGWGLNAVTTTYDCFDGTYIRANSSGVYGVLRNNSATDTSITTAFNGTDALPWVPVSGRKYQFICYLSPRSVEFWINDPVSEQTWLAGDLVPPVGYGAPIASQAVPIFLRQTISGVSAVACGFTLSRYNVRRGGTNISTSLNVLNARAGESIYSPGTLTTAANQTVTSGSLVATGAAVPANATSLLASLSGRVVETLTLAAGTDGILMSYQVPALPTAVGTTYAPNRRLRIDGIGIASFVSVVAVNAAALAKGFYIAYGSTSLSLAGVATDTVTTKAYRRVQLPIVQSYVINAAAGAMPQSTMSYFAFQTPIFVNPGEYVALVTNNNAAATSGAVTHNITFDFSWE